MFKLNSLATSALFGLVMWYNWYNVMTPGVNKSQRTKISRKFSSDLRSRPVALAWTNTSRWWFFCVVRVHTKKDGIIIYDCIIISPNIVLYYISIYWCLNRLLYVFFIITSYMSRYTQEQFDICFMIIPHLGNSKTSQVPTRTTQRYFRWGETSWKALRRVDRDDQARRGWSFVEAGKDMGVSWK